MCRRYGRRDYLNKGNISIKLGCEIRNKPVTNFYFNEKLQMQYKYGVDQQKTPHTFLEYRVYALKIKINL